MFDQHIQQDEQGVLIPKTVAGEQLLKAFIDEQISSHWMHIFFDSWDRPNPAICLFFDRSCHWEEETGEYKTTLYWQPGLRGQNEDENGRRLFSLSRMKSVVVRVRLVSSHPRKGLYRRFGAPSPALIVEWQLRHCNQESLLAQEGSPLPLGEDSWAAIPPGGDFSTSEELNPVQAFSVYNWRRPLPADFEKREGGQGSWSQNPW